MKDRDSFKLFGYCSTGAGGDAIAKLYFVVY